MQLSTLVLSSAVFVSCVLASASKFVSNESFKSAAISGIEFVREKLRYQQDLALQHPRKGLLEPYKNDAQYVKFVNSLSSEELEAEIALTREVTQRALEAYEEVMSLVASDSLKFDELFVLLSYDSMKMWRQLAATEILDKAEKAVDESLSQLDREINVVLERLRDPQIASFLPGLSFTADSEISLIRLAQNSRTQLLLANKSEIASLKEYLSRSQISFEEMERILSHAQIFDVKVTDRLEKTAQTQQWFDWTLESGNFTSKGRNRFMKLASLLQFHLKDLSRKLFLCRDCELISFLHSINFANLMLTSCAYPAVLRDAMSLQYSNLTLKKALFFKAQLQSIFDSNLSILNLILTASSDKVFCNRFNINIVINLAKEIGLTEANTISMENIFIPS